MKAILLLSCSLILFLAGSVNAFAQSTANSPTKTKIAKNSYALVTIRLVSLWAGIPIGSIKRAVAQVDDTLKYRFSGDTIIIDITGKKVSRNQIVRAFRQKNLVVTKFRQKEIAAPKFEQFLHTTGGGWTTSNSKARVALEKIAGISFALVGRGNVVLLTSQKKIDSKKVVQTLKKYNSKIKKASPLIPFKGF